LAKFSTTHERQRYHQQYLAKNPNGQRATAASAAPGCLAQSGSPGPWPTLQDRPSSVVGLSDKSAVDTQRPRRRVSGVRYGLQAVASVLLAAAWCLLGVGLLLSTPSPDPLLDLEAGGAFAANFTVYFPYFGLSVAVVVVVITGLLPRRPAAAWWVLACVGGVAAFAAWVAAQSYLTAYLPELWGWLVRCLWLSAAAGMIALASTLPRTLGTTRGRG
jgi:hypothetical protein